MTETDHRLQAQEEIDAWLSQPVGFALRAEWLAADMQSDPQRIRTWLIEAYLLGYENMRRG